MKYNVILAAAFAIAAFPASVAAADKLAAAREIINEVKSQMAPDSRQVVAEISASRLPSGAIVLRGATSEAGVRAEAIRRMAAAGIDIADSITVYPTDRWAQVRLSAASLRTRGAHAGEMATQALMGTPLRVLQSGGDWWRVQTPDGYIAYIPSSSVVEKTPAQMRAWRGAKRFIVTSLDQVKAYNSPTATGPRDVVTDLVNGCIVTIPEGRPNIVNRRYHIELPDGREAYVDTSALKNIDQWAAQTFNPELILDVAYSLEGTPYLWGGTSTKAVDCSGLAKTAYFANGIILMRDASQQALTGTRIEAENWRDCRAGDLLFFGTRAGKVTHVAIYDSNGDYVHSSGRVKRNSVDPTNPSYLTTPFLHSVRIGGNEGTRGITRAAEHPWYYNL